MAQWVQHISGQGEKWEVIEEDEVYRQWRVGIPVQMKCDDSDGRCHWLPKSEYVPCDPPPPERWVDVSSETYIITAGDTLCAFSHVGDLVSKRNGYRLQKVQFPTTYRDEHLSFQRSSDTWAFIVEKKEQL